MTGNIPRERARVRAPRRRRAISGIERLCTEQIREGVCIRIISALGRAVGGPMGEGDMENFPEYNMENFPRRSRICELPGPLPPGSRVMLTRPRLYSSPRRYAVQRRTFGPRSA